MRKIKILPVYPEFPETFWSFKKAVSYINKKSVMPPLGLATVLAMVPSDRFEIQRIVDLNVEPLKEESVKNADILFTSTMVVQEQSHNEVLDMAKFYGKKVVAGGPFPTSYPERNSKADFIVADEAEITLKPFLEDLVKGTPQKIYTRENIIKDGRNSWPLTKTGRPYLTKTPIPRWDLADLSQYSAFCIQYSRGCPHDCEFCDVTKLFGREPLTKTPQQVISELNFLYKMGCRGAVMFVDDNLIGNKKNLKELLPVLIKWQEERNYPFNFFTEASIELATESNKSILENMVKAGFNQVFIGIESLDREVLEETNKKQNIRVSQFDAIRKIQNAGIEVTGGFIVGFDKEKPEVFDKLFDFIQQSGIIIAMPGLLTALKGTKLYNRLKKEGRLKYESEGNNTHNLSFNFKTTMNERFLIENYKNLLARLFDDKNYYSRCRVLQENLGDSYRVPNRKNLEGILAFGKSLKNHLFSKGGLEYAKYLLWTALKNPRLFPEAVNHAIKLEHFKAITNSMLEADDYISETSQLYESFKKEVESIVSKYTNYRKRAELISNIAAEMLSYAESRYNKLHKDFRSSAENALMDLKRKIFRDVEEYQACLEEKSFAQKT